MKVTKGDSGYVHVKGNFPRCVPRVTWNDIIKTIDRSYQGQNKFYMSGNMEKCPYFGLYNPEPIGTVSAAFDEVFHLEKRVCNMDIYLTFSKVTEANGRHQDDHDVLIAQSIGSTTYRFDDGYEAVMTPGDSLYIPAWVYHHPFANCPRVNLSFGLRP